MYYRDMYIDVVPNRSSPPAILLRESWRENGQMKKRTLANISHWPPEKIESFRRLLRDEKLLPVTQAFRIEESLPHGHVEAVLGTIRKIGLDYLIASRPSRHRDLVIAMIVEQIIHHDSKLADTRNWHSDTVGDELGCSDADENELYEALDWLVDRQAQIEKNLASQHLREGCRAFYDVTSSYYEGSCCSLARWGYSRDKKKGLPIIVYGTLTDEEGRPIGVQVYPGNTTDAQTVCDQVKKLREQFGLQKVVLVGDRGMLTETCIEDLRQYPGLGWISALCSKAIRKLMDKDLVSPSLFDRARLAEIHSPDYPGERLIACFNPLLAEEREKKREQLLKATEKLLAKISRQVQHRTKKPLSQDEIGVKVGRVLGKHKVGKHFHIHIGESLFEWSRKQESISREQQLDGIYIVRTSESEKSLSAYQAVRQYKALSHVERVYRTVKGLEILVRPIRHRTESRVKAHIFLCMLAYYVEWHMRKSLAPLLFDDELVELSRRRKHPVAKAVPSDSAEEKKRTLITSDGLPVHSFRTLLNALGKRCKNRCRLNEAGPEASFMRVTEMDDIQRKAFNLLGLM